MLIGKWDFFAGKVKHHGVYYIVPCFSVWYDRLHFLETGIYTPAFGIQIGWFNFSFGLTIQKGY